MPRKGHTDINEALHSSTSILQQASTRLHPNPARTCSSPTHPMYQVNATLVNHGERPAAPVVPPPAALQLHHHLLFLNGFPPPAPFEEPAPLYLAFPQFHGTYLCLIICFTCRFIVKNYQARRGEGGTAGVEHLVFGTFHHTIGSHYRRSAGRAWGGSSHRQRMRRGGARALELSENTHGFPPAGTPAHETHGTQQKRTIVLTLRGRVHD